MHLNHSKQSILILINFQAEMIPKYLLPPSGVVDIFTVHTRLNPEEHRKVLHPDTVFVTAVRDPVELFESFFNYYKLSHVYGAELEEFLNWPFEVFDIISYIYLHNYIYLINPLLHVGHYSVRIAKIFDFKMRRDNQKKSYL